MKKYEYAILFSIEETEESTIFVPQKIVRGIYDKKTKKFITDDGKCLEHIIDTDNNIGFAYRNDITEDRVNDLFEYANGFDYEFSLQTIDNDIIPVISAIDKESNIEDKSEEEINDEENQSCLYDRDVFSYYLDRGFNEYTRAIYNIGSVTYPEIEERLLKLGEPNIKELYEILTSKVKGQDNKIKEILGYIWKHYYDNKNYHNILVTGSKGVGKSTILKTIEENINIPCSRITITHFGININSGLTDLYNKTGGDIEKAEHGIIIIDDSENLTTEEGKYLNKYNSAQQDLITLINEGIFNISDDEKEPLYFNTKNLFIIMAGNFSKLKPYLDKKVGISICDENHGSDIINDTNLENNFFTKFARIIKLNDLSRNDYLDILYSKEGILERTKELYKKNNVNIEIDDSTLEYIADISSKMPYGAITINSLLERVLATTTYDVATNDNRKANVEVTVNSNGLLEANLKTSSKCKTRKREM